MSTAKFLATVMVLGSFLLVKFSPSSLPESIFASSSSNESLSTTLNSIDTYTKITYKPPVIYSSSYLLLDSSTNEQLVGKNASVRSPIASTTKMMTALVAVDKLPLDKVVTIRKEATLINGSKIGLLTGEQIKVIDLIKGMLIYSGNDAAYSLAFAYDDSSDITQFVAEMNRRVTAIGLKDTYYQDPAGLDDTGYSTAFDLSQIAKVLLQDKTLAPIVTTPDITVKSTDGAISHTLKNSNRLVIPDSGYYLPNALGVKTGFTPTAGHLLVSALSLNGRVLIGVIMNTTNFSITASAQEMSKLFRWADDSVRVGQY